MAVSLSPVRKAGRGNPVSLEEGAPGQVNYDKVESRSLDVTRTEDVPGVSQAVTPLSIAFVWHMHQPDYKDDLTGEYLMPWVRLHALKDYVDMVTILADYPRIRQTFNLVPILMAQLEDYCRPETKDHHLALTLADTLTDADRVFILERFFDAHDTRMIAKSPYYYGLFERRNRQASLGSVDPEAFTLEELWDITVWFHLVWTDPVWFKQVPDLQALWDKGRGFTRADRERLIACQREIIQSTLATYKAFQERGQIEVTTTPYYHPILPLLLDSESAKVAMPHGVMPEERYQAPEDAERQVAMAYEKYQAFFGQPAVGVWPAEQAISPAALELLAAHGFQWAISSEGNLAASLGVVLEKDPYGNVVNAEVLCRPYRYAGLNLLFRHLTLSDLIGFHYANMSPRQAVDDMMIRIKQVQSRCTEAGISHPILTIALDGENCWESYPDDGHPFLHELYRRLSDDPTLNVCRVRDYFEALPPDACQPLSHVHSGSWIHSNFHIWIGDPVKNAAWTYLKRTRDDLIHLEASRHYRQEFLQKAWTEIYIAEGSDWFWWYGDPHNSGQDDMFDMQFRCHLANVYRILDMEIPSYLDIPLTVTMGRPVTPPEAPITPVLSGRRDTMADWCHAGCLDLTHGAMHRGTRLLNKVYFGSDKTSLYLRFDLNHAALTPYHEIFVYACTPGKTRHNSPIRLKSATGQTVSTQRYHYAYEIQMGALTGETPIIQGAEALPDFLWHHRLDLVQEVVCQEVLDVALAFEAMGTDAGEYLQLTFAVVQGGLLDEFQPEHFVVSIKRHDGHYTEPTLLPSPAHATSV